MSVKIEGVEKRSPCAKKGIKAGDELLSLNGHEINDCLDYSFYGLSSPLEISWKNSRGKTKSKKLRACDINSCGLSFGTYLMDKQHSCFNKCVFCFIDQMPRGMRDSLYFKDDDSRLSFLFGNYITLTNLSQHDAGRITEMHISPVNVSVHTMNPELRVKMMKNRRAGESLDYLKQFSDAGITVNAQLVLCPGINDGDELKYSLEKLGEYKNIGSIAAVPVGLTRFREGLFPLEPYTPAKAREVISLIDEFNAVRVENGGDILAYASDEFYLNAGIPFPSYEYYGEFPQLDNGVGMWVLTEKEFSERLGQLAADKRKRKAALATGMLALPLMKKLAAAFCEKFSGSEIEVYGIENRFFGDTVTVAGLVTGADLTSQLSERGFCSPLLLLPSVMFRSGDDSVFLDDMTKEQAQEKLGTHITAVLPGGAELADAFYSAE